MPHIHKSKDVDKVFWNVLMNIMEYDTNDKTYFNKIRKTGQRDGAPAWKIDEDIIFYGISRIESEYENDRQESYENRELVTRYNNQLKLHLTIYGPNASDIVEEINYKIMLPDTQEFFNKYYIYLSGFPTAPISLSEEFNGQWWSRYDMEIQYKHQIERRLKYNYISGINIDILADNGMEREIILEEEI